MAKREEADSGLRAGFITEEEALRQRREQEFRASTEMPLTPPSTPEEKQEKKEIDNVPSPEAFLKDIPGADTSTIEIHGISGKAIPGVIKLVKKPKKAPQVKASEDEKKSDAVPADQKLEKPDAKTEEAAVKPAPPAEKAEPSVQEKPAPAQAEDRPRVSAPAAAVRVEDRVAPSKAEAPVVSPGPAAAAPSVAEPAPEKKAPRVDEVPAGKEPEAAAAPSEAGRSEEGQAPLKEKESVSAAKEKAPAPAQETASPAARQKAVPPRTVPAQTPPAPVAAAPPAPRKEKPRMSIAEKSMPLTKKITRPEPSPVSRAVPRSYGPEADQKRPKPIRPQRGSYVGRESRPAPAADRPASEGSSYGRRTYRDTPPRPQSSPRSAPPRPSSGAPRGRAHTPRPTRPGLFPPSPPPFEEDNADTSQRTRQRRGQRQNRDRDRYDQKQRRDQQELMERDVRVRRTHRKDSAGKTKHAAAPLSKVVLPETLTVKEFAEIIKKTTADVIMKLMELGVMATINQDIDYDTAAIVASEFGIKTEKHVEVTPEDILFDDSEDKPEDLVPRPPVVVVLGHVDHGKTTILDYFRKSSMTKEEAGGITQHIGAYTVPVRDRIVTFLDTPGHEAFTTLRARGAQVTDIAVLVVAADDGVMPQTIEAINHARAAKTEIIVAINKIDRPEADVDRVKRELAQQGLMDASWGGNTEMVPVSAKMGTNMDELLDIILLTADVMELKANPNRQAKGTVIEARLDRAKGPVATVLIQRGTLRTGDAVVINNTYGHVRAMVNDHGQEVKEAGPSMPVEISGISDVPEGGDILYQVKDERTARELVAKRKEEEREMSLRKSSRMTLDSLFSRTGEEEVIDLNLIVKADTQGSVEAIQRSMEELSNDKIAVHVIHGAVGAIAETDVRLAEVSDAIIIGFNVRPTSSAALIASTANVDIRTYRVIYEAIDEVRDAMRGMLKPKFKEVVVGRLEVRDVFRISNVGTVAGCYVSSGRINRRDQVRLLRDGVVVFETTVASLRRFKDDVREVAAGYECGVGLENYNDIKVGDEIEAFVLEEEQVTEM